MTDNEIIKALKCCIFGECENCPHDEETACKENLNQEILCLINRQKAEIEEYKIKLNDDCEVCAECHNEFCDLIKKARTEAKTEAIKEFAERLKKRGRNSLGDYFVIKWIDDLVKEMVGDAE